MFDGTTPKGKGLWKGVPGNVFASRLLCETMKNANPENKIIAE